VTNFECRHGQPREEGDLPEEERNARLSTNVDPIDARGALIS
jgi:hypothetical protein